MRWVSHAHGQEASSVWKSASDFEETSLILALFPPGINIGELAFSAHIRVCMCVCVRACVFVCLVNTIATHAFRWSAPGGCVHASAPRTRGRESFKAPAVAAGSAERSLGASRRPIWVEAAWRSRPRRGEGGVRTGPWAVRVPTATEAGARVGAYGDPRAPPPPGAAQVVFWHPAPRPPAA